MSKESLDYLQLKKFKPGDILFTEGETTSFFYIIDSGDVEVFIKPDGKQKVVLNVVSAGEALGEFAFITKKPRTASAQAITNVTAYEVSEEGYKQLLGELPEWAQSMLGSLVQRLSDSTELIKRYSQNKDLWEETTSVINGKKINTNS
jgi:CRP/FNR family cyclic AMP-dependent transcriptional regulator